jgi:hypothetical protein
VVMSHAFAAGTTRASKTGCRSLDELALAAARRPKPRQAAMTLVVAIATYLPGRHAPRVPKREGVDHELSRRSSRDRAAVSGVREPDQRARWPVLVRRSAVTQTITGRRVRCGKRSASVISQMTFLRRHSCFLTRSYGTFCGAGRTDVVREPPLIGPSSPTVAADR